MLELVCFFAVMEGLPEVTIEAVTMITIPSKRLDSRQSQIFQCTVAADFDIAINAFAFHYFGADHNGSFLREWHWGGHAYFSISAVRQVNRSARPIHPPGHGESSARKILVQCRYA